MDINDSRKRIDEIDNQIIELFKERMSVAADIAMYKKEHNLHSLDSARERQLLNRISELAGTDLERYARTLYNMMMEVSKAYQNTLLLPQSDLSKKVVDAIETTDKLFPERADVGCQGVEGAYSQLATQRIFRYPNIKFYPTFESVVKAVDTGEIQYGVLPVENSTAGTVYATVDLMAKYNFYIVKSFRLKVDHNLLVKPGATLDDIKVVYSHEQAINQCSEFFKAHPNIKAQVVANTAMAAEMVSKGDDKSCAAISSIACADLYNLDILQRTIQDKGNNYTRFICISKKLEIYPGADRTSLVLVVDHKPGALYKVMSKFSALGINLLKLESRPIPDSNFEFRFYIDVEVSVYSDALTQMIFDVAAQTTEFKYLGSYSEMV